jgi:hypothetical protein
MDRDWSLEVRLTFKKPIGDKRATRSWNQDAVAVATNVLIHKPVSERRRATLVPVDIVTEGVAGWINCSGNVSSSDVPNTPSGPGPTITASGDTIEKESEDTYPTKPVKPTLTRRHRRARERPASKAAKPTNSAQVFTLAPIPHLGTNPT